MSSAAAAQLLTPADLETRLAALGIPIARLIAAAHIARSTWSAWQAGRTRPRPDRWTAATEAFAALVAEAEAVPPAAPAEPSGANVVSLAGSSPSTDAPLRFTPVATAPAPVEPPIAGDPDAAVIAAADRTAELARREWATTSLSVRQEKRFHANPSPAGEIAVRAADRLTMRLNRRLRPACRNLARQRAATPAAVGAKARAVLAVGGTSTSDDWWTALRDSTLRDAAQLDSASEIEHGSPSLAGQESAAFTAAAQAWAVSEVRLDAAIEAAAMGCATEGSLDAFIEVHSARRCRFLDAPARTLDGALAKSLVLATYIQEGDGPLSDCFEALQGAGQNSQEARYAFPVMKDLSAIAAARGVSVEALATLPTGDAGPERDEVARLSAEWVRSCAEDWRGDEALEDVLKARDETGFERLQAKARAHSEVLRRIAGLRSTAPDALALKAAAVLADCRDASELDADIARLDGTSRGEAEVAVAMSLVRDMIAIHGGRVRALVATVEAAAAEPPIAAEDMPGDARAAA